MSFAFEAPKMAQKDAEYNIDKTDLIVKAEPMEETFQVMIPQAHRSQLSYRSRRSIKVGLLEKRKRYDFMKKKFF